MNGTPPPEVIHPFVNPEQRQQLVLAGLFAVLSLPLLGEKFTWALGALALACGLAMGYVATDPLAAILHLTPDWKNALASALGFLGYTVLGIIMGLFQIIKKDPWGTLQRVAPFLGKKEG